nr:MAG TPA: hypothetical protein [Caudoviricetes sp.]
MELTLFFLVVGIFESKNILYWFKSKQIFLCFGITTVIFETIILKIGLKRN